MEKKSTEKDLKAALQGLREEDVARISDLTNIPMKVLRAARGIPEEEFVKLARAIDCVNEEHKKTWFSRLADRLFR